MKEDQKNILIFALIAAFALFAWTPIMNYFFPPANPPVTKVENGKSVPLPAGPGTAPTANAPKANRDRAIVLQETRRVLIETPRLKGSINLQGARFDDLELKDYAETVKKDSPPIRLLSPEGAAGSYFAQFNWSRVQGDQRVLLAPANLVWQASAPKLTPATPVTLTAVNGSQRYTIELSVDANYMFTVKQSIANLGSGPIEAAPYAQIVRSEKSTDLDQFAANVGPMVVSGGSAAYLNYGDIEKAPAKFETRGGWAGFTDHYWLTSVIPAQGSDVTLTQLQTPNKAFLADYTLKPRIVEAGTQMTYTSHFFAGAKEVKVLDAYEKNLGIVQFDRAIDWGWFGLIEEPIFWYLDLLFHTVGNFGVAIILLTFTIRLLLFPIAQRQFASMANMRAIQPKMKALQERYKDDKQKQQTEIMKLYKEEKVNPLAGCLPLLLQIPIMFALYKVLLLTIEMRHQPFALWIHDLSAPDPATIINLFGYLQFTPPSFLAIGVIPVLLGISMYFQIRLNPAPMDEMQKQIFQIMPWMLMFVMAPFAVGLQIYWITSNIITILQQTWLYSKHPALKEPVKKDVPAK
ncbi:membrane protein insertase YidC [Sphingomonas sp. LB-2]|uniref:membrane protein insertase YidC n=1 Tax=Sphingomonas caeni TaxID=2984949 RepID=UPI002230C3BC|nr:membrane protein insertase YidC [Sphingomonas caeni]MCW3849398.1 membrane protein insertase YidC [Sphingomonas caeni]